MTNTQSHAKTEFDILKATIPDALVLEFEDEILALCEKFGMSGQSGGSAPYTAGAISSAVKKLCLQQTIAPITGDDNEWSSPFDDIGTVQNRRCYALFKQTDGECYFLDAIVWNADTPGESGNNWDNFTGTVQGISSRQYIKGFPFEPKTFNIDVTREKLPADWNEEPFYQDKSYYLESEYNETGIKRWIPGDKYRYVIKDMKQLEQVWEYYQKK